MSTVDQRTANGFVLLLVIAVLGLLALVAATFVKTARVHVRTIASQVEAARAEAIAEAGVNLAVLKLDQLRAQRNDGRRTSAANGTQWHCRHGEHYLLIQVQDEGGKIDLNFASERLLRALLVGLGVLAPDRASAYVEALMDFRDRDDDKRPNGAEKAEYVAAGRELGPKNGAFAIIEELYQVLGLDNELVERMLPFVTTHSGKDGIDPEVASRELIELIANGDKNFHLGGLEEEIDFAYNVSGLPFHFVAQSARSVFTIRSEALMISGVRFIHEAIVDISPTRGNAQSRKAYRAWRWRRAASANQAPLPDLASPTVPPC